MAEPRPRPIPTLLGDAVRDTQELVSKEIALLRAEMAEGLHHLTLAMSLFMAAGVLVVTALMVWILALVKGLAVLLQSDALAAPSSGACSRPSPSGCPCGGGARRRSRAWSRPGRSGNSVRTPPSSRSAWMNASTTRKRRSKRAK